MQIHKFIVNIITTILISHYRLTKEDKIAPVCLENQYFSLCTICRPYHCSFFLNNQNKKKKNNNTKIQNKKQI